MNINMPTSLAGGRYQLGQLVGRGGMEIGRAHV